VNHSSIAISRSGARTKESRFPAPAAGGGRRLHSTTRNGARDPSGTARVARSPNQGRRVAYGSKAGFFRLVLAALGLIILAQASLAGERRFAGAVSSATPEATAAGIAVLEQGGNAVDAAVAVSLAIGVSEPAGSGIAGQTVMLVSRPGGQSFVVQGTTWSPAILPEEVTAEQLAYGRTASSVPSTLRVLDLVFQRYGSGQVSWAELVEPSVKLARDGVVIGPFRARSFSNYSEDLLRQPAAAGIFVNPEGRPWQAGQVFRQPLLAATLERIARVGAMDFYRGEIADKIVADMKANGGWISATDLADFPEPRIVEPLRGTYRGWDVLTLPPPFGGWVVLQALNVLESMPQETLGQVTSARSLALLQALAIAHSSRQTDPVTDYSDYQKAVELRISKPEAARLLREASGGETTHFSVVDADGLAVSVTQSIDSYFGSRVVHPGLGFLYNNYMQGFQVEDQDAPYYLTPREMPKSSMSATILTRDGRAQLVLGSPGSARIISAVAQVTSHWVDVGEGIESAVAAYRVHVVPPDKAYVEGPEIPPELLSGMAGLNMSLTRPAFGVSDSQLDAYFGGVHALAIEQGSWTGTADPRRDGVVGFAWRTDP